jgi:alkylhydroperoxidase family enzyme
MEEMLAKLTPPGGEPLALFRTMARNPRLFRRFMAGGLLDRGTITLREREIVIDRTCARNKSEYEWGVHVAIFAEKAGLGPEEIAATVADDAEAACWSERERLLIRLVDQLHDSGRIDDGLWGALSASFTDEQILELVMLAGHYHMVSFIVNASGLANESFAARFPAPARGGH